MPVLITAARWPAAARRRESTLGQRSSPLSVDAVPSVMESPNATITGVPAGAIMSMASRKYQEAVEYGKAASSSAWPLEPAPGAVTYEVCSALACQVIGPLAPATWKLTASLRPRSSLPFFTKGSATASLHTDSPGATLTLPLPPNVIARLVPGITAEPDHCMPANAPSNVTGCAPSALEKRIRALAPQNSGLTTRRNDWSRAPVSAEGNASDRLGCADGLPTG